MKRRLLRRNPKKRRQKEKKRRRQPKQRKKLKLLLKKKPKKTVSQPRRPTFLSKISQRSLPTRIKPRRPSSPQRRQNQKQFVMQRKRPRERRKSMRRLGPPTCQTSTSRANSQFLTKFCWSE